MPSKPARFLTISLRLLALDLPLVPRAARFSVRLFCLSACDLAVVLSRAFHSLALFFFCRS